ncbi:unnamed protein product [Calypogeia fissa]
MDWTNQKPVGGSKVSAPAAKKPQLKKPVPFSLDDDEEYTVEDDIAQQGSKTQSAHEVDTQIKEDGSEGEGARKVAKSISGGGNDDGGSSAPQSPMSQDNTSPTASENVAMTAEKSSQEHGKSAAGKGKNAMGSGKKAGAGPKLPISSPLGSDDDGDGKGRGGGGGDKGGGTQEEDDEEEERMENLELGKYNTVDPDRMQQVLNCFTKEQMSRYECYRRSGFQRANMRRLLASVAGCPISIPMTIVMSGISKMFVGELVEIGRIVMTERNDVGPIRPCHIREAYRRLKLEGKVPSRGRAPLFR